MFSFLSQFKNFLRVWGGVCVCVWTVYTPSWGPNNKAKLIPPKFTLKNQWIYWTYSQNTGKGLPTGAWVTPKYFTGKSSASMEEKDGFPKAASMEPPSPSLQQHMYSSTSLEPPSHVELERLACNWQGWRWLDTQVTVTKSCSTSFYEWLSAAQLWCSFEGRHRCSYEGDGYLAQRTVLCSILF